MCIRDSYSAPPVAFLLSLGLLGLLVARTRKQAEEEAAEDDGNDDGDDDGNDDGDDNPDSVMTIGMSEAP